MRRQTVLLPLLLLTVSNAQEPAPIQLFGKDHAPVCRGKLGDAPDCVTPPRPKYAPDPTYPEKERQARREGTFLLQLVVGEDGLPRDVTVSRKLSPGLDQAAIDAVQKWKLSPATKDGKPVAVQINVEIFFHLN